MKTATTWYNNPTSKVNRFKYNDSTVIYSSSVRTYSGVVPTNMSDKGEKPTSWIKVNKLPAELNKTTKIPSTWVNV